MASRPGNRALREIFGLLVPPHGFHYAGIRSAPFPQVAERREQIAVFWGALPFSNWSVRRLRLIQWL